MCYIQSKIGITIKNLPVGYWLSLNISFFSSWIQRILRSQRCGATDGKEQMSTCWTFLRHLGEQERDLWCVRWLRCEVVCYNHSSTQPKYEPKLPSKHCDTEYMWDGMGIPKRSGSPGLQLDIRECFPENYWDESWRMMHDSEEGKESSREESTCSHEILGNMAHWESVSGSQWLDCGARLGNGEAQSIFVEIIYTEQNLGDLVTSRNEGQGKKTSITEDHLT